MNDRISSTEQCECIDDATRNRCTEPAEMLVDADGWPRPVPMCAGHSLEVAKLDGYSQLVI